MSTADPLKDQGGDPRVTTRIPPRHLAQLEWLVEQGRYSSRSDAIRQAVISLIDQERGDR